MRPTLADAARGRILFGGDYNPEQWPEETWHEDVRLMKAGNVNSVTLGFLSWSALEPEPGAREFGWPDRLMDLQPDTLPRDADGRTEGWGGQQHFSPSSATYPRYAAAITEDLAARYAGHGDEAAAAFRRWLRTRYDTWDRILPPRHAHDLKNPAQVADFRRFTSDMLLECLTAERDIVRQHTPHTPVTSNFMRLWIGRDAWRRAGEEDVVSVGLCPDPRDPLGGQRGALVHDLTRSRAHGPWMLMEQAAGPVNRHGVNHPEPRGLNRLWSLQAVARGADAVCCFQWRQSRQGAEKFRSGMVSHAGEQGRTFQEIRRIGAEPAALGAEVKGTRIDADVAVLHDWHSWWAGAHEGRPSREVDLPEVLTAWHRALWEAHLTRDFAHPEQDLSGYRFVVVPQLYLLTDAAVGDLLSCVAGGGTMVCGFLTGVADEDDRIRPGGMDARLRGLFGIRTLHEWWPPEAGESVRCEGFRGTLWSEEIEAEPGVAETVPYRGGELLASVAAGAGVRPVPAGLPAGVEAVRRGGLLFLLNHRKKPVTGQVPGSHHELLGGGKVAGSVTPDRYGVAVLRP
ncbi:beta-galactosidase [Streptomyces lasalocidi]